MRSGSSSGAETLVTRAPGYRLNVVPGELDLARVRAARRRSTRRHRSSRAVELRRRGARALARAAARQRGLRGPARHEVGRLSELHLTTQIELLEAELELGRHAQLIGELELLVAAHPYQERLRGLLMLALYRSGRQAEALQAYRPLAAS